MQNQASSTARAHARTLRIGMTDAERRLWSCMRLEQLGSKFRRQHPIGSFIVDFACLDPKLVIEIDGSQHLEQAAYDNKRSELTRQGFAVLRFWANEVLSDTVSVVSSIEQVLGSLRQPAPTPALPQWGRERECKSLRDGIRAGSNKESS